VRHLFLELELAQPFDKALVLDLIVPVLEFHDELFLLQTTERIFRCVQWSWLAQTQLFPQSLTGRERVKVASKCQGSGLLLDMVGKG
jgi:hypothetical protein